MSTVARDARRLARHAALDALSVRWRVTGRSERALSRPRVHFVYLHSVPPHQEARFSELLDRWGGSHELIGYSEAVSRIRHGPIDRPYMCVSFDDGFASCRRAAQILHDHGTTGCFFVPPAFVGCSTVPDARRFFRTARGVDEPALTWGDLEQMQAQGHEVGSHTMHHFNLATLEPTRFRDEIGGAVEVLRERLGAGEHFAWPLGRFSHFTPRAARAVFDIGHLSCASAVRGAHVTTADRGKREVCVRRDHVDTGWPVEHSHYLIARSAVVSAADSNTWPPDWERAA